LKFHEGDEMEYDEYMRNIENINDMKKYLAKIDDKYEQ